MDFNQETLLSILNIIFIDIVLGGDNAVVIALACRNLPEQRRNKAIVLGTSLAVILRITLTAMMLSLLQIPYLLLSGGLFLILIAYKLIADKDNDIKIKSGHSMFGAVKTIVVADLVMGLDNILGIAGAAKGNLFLVIIGLCVSVPIIVWGSKLILTAMDHIPGLIYIGAAVLGYTASGMIIGEPQIHDFFIQHSYLKTLLTVIIITGILLCGWAHNHSQSSRHFNDTF